MRLKPLIPDTNASLRAAVYAVDSKVCPDFRRGSLQECPSGRGDLESGFVAWGIDGGLGVKLVGLVKVSIAFWWAVSAVRGRVPLTSDAREPVGAVMTRGRHTDPGSVG